MKTFTAALIATLVAAQEFEVAAPPAPPAEEEYVDEGFPDYLMDDLDIDFSFTAPDAPEADAWWYEKEQQKQDID